MTCTVCKDINLDTRCHKCGRLPTDPQLAILTEAYDYIQVMESYDKTNGVSWEVYECLRKLAGLTRHLILSNKKLEREIVLIKEKENLH